MKEHGQEIVDQLDSMLRLDLVQVPPEFQARVVARIRQEGRVVPHPRPWGHRIRRLPHSLWHWLALATGVALGFSELAGLVFGLWAAVAAG